MAKRANGEGSIRKRKDGKWLVTFPTGLYKENGKRDLIYKYCATQAEAVEALRQLQSEKAMGVCHSKAVVKTGDWINTWIEKHKAPKLAPSTLTSYRNNFRVHIKPYVGEVALRELTTYHIQKMLDSMVGSLSLFVKVYMHTLRHTYATRCFEAGVNIKAISEQLGHANVKTTYNIYVHLLEDTKVKEIDKLSEIDKFIASEDATESSVVIPFPESGKAV